jgi:hypothetical protein
LDLGSRCCRKRRRKKIGGEEGRLTENLCILERRVRKYIGEMHESSRSLKKEDIWLNAVTLEIILKQKGKGYQKIVKVDES